MTDEKKVDVLDEVKSVEKKIKRVSFLKLIPQLKRMAKEVNTLKKKADFLLEEVGIEEKDIKRIIDFINSLPDVQLSKSDIEELKEDTKEEVKETKEKVQEDWSKNLEEFASTSSSNSYSTSATGNSGGVTLTSGDSTCNVAV